MNKFTHKKMRLIKLEAVIALFLAWLLLRIKGMQSMKWTHKMKYNSPESVEKIYDSVSNISKFMPFSCKCIEIAFAVKLIAAFHKMEAFLIIGVRLQPFAAHAWVESGGSAFGIAEKSKYKELGKF